MSAPHDPWAVVTWFVACQHCGATTTRSNLTFSGGLHCTRCDDITDLPQEVAYRTQVYAARAADAERHQQEIAATTMQRNMAIAAADLAEGQIATLRATVDQQKHRITELETGLMNQIDNSVALAHTVQAREARITELETALKDLLIAVTFAHTVEFTPENHCWEARVPVAFVEQARQALETP